MITPIKAMTINQIIERQDDLLVSADDVKAIAQNERAKAFKEFEDSYREFCKAPSDESCLIEDECEGMCIDCFEKWLTTKKQN